MLRGSVAIWVDDERKVMTVAEAVQHAGVSAETVRRWCGEARLVACSLAVCGWSRGRGLIATLRGVAADLPWS